MGKSERLQAVKKTEGIWNSLPDDGNDMDQVKAARKIIRKIEKEMMHCISETKGDMFTGSVCGYCKWIKLPICNSLSSDKDEKYWQELRVALGMKPIGRNSSSDKFYRGKLG